MSSETVQRRLDSLTKPPGSLGRLEQLLLDYARITGQQPPAEPELSALLFCGDHGVTEAGVSAWPQSVTQAMYQNIARGGAAINAMLSVHGVKPRVIDAGMAPHGTRNFAVEPAMTNAEAEQAIHLGRQCAQEASGHLLLCGEMGIGNSTAATALLCAYTGCDPLEVTGPGAGLAPDAVPHKAQVIRDALARHPWRGGLQTAATFGGYEILAIAGVILQAAAQRRPVLMDGFIATSACLVVQALEPAALGVVLYSHRSAEPGHRRMLEHLGARPLLDLDLRLGEGTGAALAFGLFRSACAVYHRMATFAEAAIPSGG
ncbi:MAG: nicotinate-nucleotide--dimethylbenzimidazole phosphoribosyltransferase [Bryobacterales bacterium]|nr:nicotinate-nucleotide--dimethylbenzimidazole phosphoribosyltransferase [Bryobacterales bacterium]